jgi:hypothetical protein
LVEKHEGHLSTRGLAREKGVTKNTMKWRIQCVREDLLAASAYEARPPVRLRRK